VAAAMRFSDSFLDEIRARLPVSEVVRRRIALKKQGREWRGFSPFNKEKTPSFFVNDQKGFYHDFSSGKSGDQFTFLMETEGLSFPEAVERLAAMAGLQVPKPSREAERQEARRKSLHEVLEAAAKFFEAQFATPIGARARDYARQRGLIPETIREFRIGFAPNNRFALKEHLGKLGIAVEDMVEAGLLIAGEDIPVPYDRFRDRLMFPIHDRSGRVIAFGGRAISRDAEPKYLNSPETSVFHKSAAVFNFHRARQPAHDDGSVVVVEGYLDAIIAFQAGIKSIVATMGTALTEEQVQMVWRLSEEPIICFDGDRAGIAAAHRSIDRILPELRVGRSLRFAFLSSGQDPDELIRTAGADAFRDVLKGSLPLWDLLWAREVEGADIRTPDRRAVLEKKLYDLVRTIKDPLVAKSYYRTCRVQLSDFFWQHDRSYPKRQSGRFERSEIKAPHGTNRFGIQLILLGLLVEYPDFLDEKQQRVDLIEFDGQLESFRRSLYDLLIEHEHLSIETVYRDLKPDFYEALELVHGEKCDEGLRGYKLRQRFPIVKIDPPRSFIAECIEHFVDMLYCVQMEHDINFMATASGESLTAVHERRLIALRRELHATSERINRRDSTLADQGKELRRVHLGAPQWAVGI
jgi:DNA primase